MTSRTPDDPYLTEGIIAYIGNKRRLLPLIAGSLEQTCGARLDGLRFADLFAGSGVVSRLARRRGMIVTANDWEPYARVLNRAWLEPCPGDPGDPISAAFREVSVLNDLPAPEPEETYLARYYAPSAADPDRADYRRERLFYSRENALRLDAARNHVETLFPHGRPGFEPELPLFARTGDTDLHRCILLSTILYAAATHVNTSGVFKAYHKGFGGHGRDAMKRILSPIVFRPPLLANAPPGRVFAEDANILAARGEVEDADVVYLDPPYNQHQYGSNYHLLNTLVQWDRIPEPFELGPDGRLLRKAAIRTDWTNTRSDYCYRGRAEKAFSNLLDCLDVPVTLVSYSTDGIIPFDRLRSICESRGRVRLNADSYVTYRGGRQSNGRRDRNLEFLLMVERGRTTGERDRREARRLLLDRRLGLLRNNLLRPECLRTSGTLIDGVWMPGGEGSPYSVRTRHGVKMIDFGLPDNPELEVFEEFVDTLENCRCETRDEELGILLETWAAHPGDMDDLVRLIPRILRKCAHRKYHDVFFRHLEAVRSMGDRHPDDYRSIGPAVEKVAELAGRRLHG